MALALNLADLASRTVRTQIAGSTGGVRRIAVNAIQTIESDEGASSIWSGLARTVGSILSIGFNLVANVLQFSVSRIWSIIVSTGLYILNFNWNATDQALDEQIKQANVALAASRGALVGGTLGFLICGVIPTAALAVFNEPLALYVLKELGEEAAEEIASNAAQVIRLTLQLMVKSAFIGIFKNYRNVLRPAALGIANLMVRAGILSQTQVDRANQERNKPWSFAIALEESIDEIKDPVDQAYVEEFWDELQDACIEAGYVVAGSIDAYFSQQRLANYGLLGDDKIVEILPDRSVEIVTP